MKTERNLQTQIFQGMIRASIVTLDLILFLFSIKQY